MGNGRLGAMLFGRIADERIPLNENSLWDGYKRDTTNPEALKALPEVRRLLFEGKNVEATELAGKSMMGRPFRIKPYQVLADLWLEGTAAGRGPRLPPRAEPVHRHRPPRLQLGRRLHPGAVRLGARPGDRGADLRRQARGGEHARAPGPLAGRQGPAGPGNARAPGAARAHHPARRRRREDEPGPALRGLRPGQRRGRNADRGGRQPARHRRHRGHHRGRWRHRLPGQRSRQGLPGRRRSGGGQGLRPAARGPRPRPPGAGRSGEAGPGAAARGRV